MGLKFRPVDGTFYDLFSEAAQHLVVGAELLAEMLAADGDREDVARRMREAEHAADETTHAIVRRVNSTFVTPFDREDIYNLASGPRRRHGHDGRGRRPGPALRGAGAARRAVRRRSR